MIGRAFKAIFVFAAAAAGCGLTDVGQPLSVEVTADPESASVGDTIVFTVSGTGEFISVLTIDYEGDGEDDAQFPTGGQLGSQSATAPPFSHVYGVAGTYNAVATIFDSSGQLSDTVEVVIDGG